MSDENAIGPIDADRLRAAGIEDTGKATQQFRHLAGDGVSDDDLLPLLPLLLDALAECPDPDRALNSFSRWFSSVGGRYSHLQTLIRHPIALRLFCLVTGSSQYFADLLARHPEYFEIIANPGIRSGAKSATALYREVSALVDACVRPELKRDALRRWKAREMLRIGVRDLIGLADMPTTAHEFSNLADACVQAALDIAQAALAPAESSPALPFAIIGMGKLGGQELNYSSDIDLMFVHGDQLPNAVRLQDGRTLDALAYLTRLAEAVVKTLSEESASGHVFRVDMRLRPEGRFGALTRSLAGYRAYYDSWAESWERQALLKARFLAGDRALGEAFMAMVEPYVYRHQVTMPFIEDIRANKRRIAQKCALESKTDTNIKTGFGGIRDIEFIAQLLQLIYGGRKPRLRSPNTLTALQRLHSEGLLSRSEAHELAEDYRFLRDLEHRLQLLHGFQTQTLPPPENQRERARLARRMGFSEPERFEEDLQRRRAHINQHLQNLFYQEGGRAGEAGALPPSEKEEWADLHTLLANIDSAAAQEELKAKLAAAGFRDPAGALRALQLPMQGNEFGGMPPDTPVEFAAIAPRLLALAARSPDPDAALAGIEALALAVPNRAQLYASFDDSPMVMERLTLLGAASPPLLKRLTQHLEWMEMLFSAEEQEESREAHAGSARESREAFLQELRGRAQGAKTFESKLQAIARFYQRETLRIGAAETWGVTDSAATMAELSRLAEALLQILMELCSEQILAAHPDPDFAAGALNRVAILSLGKLGGAELGYASDWDVVCVYDERHPRGEALRSQERHALASQLIEKVHAACKSLVSYGAGIEMDLRLRPWGRKGALIHTPQSFLDYFRATAETWERQAALKARAVAGNPHVGKRLERIYRAVSFGRGLDAEEDAAVRAMKRRIETERLKPAERETDLKLGHGGLSDIEWLAQRLQLLHGSKNDSLRVANTPKALSALAGQRFISNAEADVLTAAYSLLTQARNALWLQTGMPQDTLPADSHRRRVLAKTLGYSDAPDAPAESRLWADIRAHMQEVRRIFMLRFFEERVHTVREESE